MDVNQVRIRTPNAADHLRTKRRSGQSQRSRQTGNRNTVHNFVNGFSPALGDDDIQFRVLEEFITKNLQVSFHTSTVWRVELTQLKDL